MADALVVETEQGLFCRAGGFHIDPWKPVDRAIITHAHSDHARWGSRHYLCSESGETVLRTRLGEISLQTLAYDTPIKIGDVKVSLHPAGHLLGSAQVCVEHRGEVWVISGDYKTQCDDRTCEGFSPVRCNAFITESTFGLPIYRWRPQQKVFDEINHWWRRNQEEGRTSVLYGYALGKAQRLIAGVDSGIGPILVHGSVMRFVEAYRAAGVELPEVEYASAEAARRTKGKALVIAPPSAGGSPWIRKFAPLSDAMASGWMQIRGTRRRRSLDRGFVISDHADWDGLLSTIAATGAERIGVTHGYTGVLARWLNENGLQAWTLSTRFTGDEEGEEPGDDATAEEAPENP